MTMHMTSIPVQFISALKDCFSSLHYFALLTYTIPYTNYKNKVKEQVHETNDPQ